MFKKKISTKKINYGFFILSFWAKAKTISAGQYLKRNKRFFDYGSNFLKKDKKKPTVA